MPNLNVNMNNLQSPRHDQTGIYESLPYLIMGTGVIVAVILGNLAGIVGGLTLLLIGIIVWSTRRGSRKSARRQTLPAANTSKTAVSDLLPLAWDKQYECGHATFDAHHRKLFELGNSLRNAMLNQTSKLDVELLLDELVKLLAESNLVIRAKAIKNQVDVGFKGEGITSLESHPFVFHLVPQLFDPVQFRTVG
jgi:hypothetical protein